MEEILEPYRANVSKISDIEILKKVHHRYQAACFSCTILQLSLKTMQPSSNELQFAATLAKQVVTINLSSKISH